MSHIQSIGSHGDGRSEAARAIVANEGKAVDAASRVMSMHARTEGHPSDGKPSGMEASVRGLSSVDSHPYQASFSDAPGRYGTQKISGLSCEGHGLTLHERDRPGPIHKAFSHAGPVRPLHPSADVKEEREGRKAKAKEELRDLLRGRRQNLREKKSGMKGQNDVTTSECALPGYSSVPAVHSRSLSCLSFPVRGEEEADPHTHEPRPPPLPPTGERPKRGPSSTEYRREIFSHDPSASHKQRRTEVGQEEKHPDRNPLEHSAFSQTSSSSALRDLLRERPRSRRGARRGEGDGTSKRHTPASPLSLSSAGPPASPSPSVRVSLLGVRTPVSTPLTCPADGGPVSLPLAGGDGAQVRQGGAGGERGNGGWRDRGSELRGSVQEIWGTSDDDSDSTGFAESVETELIRILAGRGGKEKRKDQMGSSSQNNVKARKRNGGMWAEGGRAPIHGDLVSVRSTAAEPLPPHGSSSASARPCGETAECPVESGWATPVIESPSLPSRRAGRPTDRQGNANEAQRRGGVQPSTEEGKVKETGREDPLLSLLRMFPSKTSLRQLAETRCLPVPPLPPPPQPVSFEEKPSPERKGGATEVPSQASLSIPTPPDPFVSPLTLSFKRETPPFVSPSLPTAPLVKHETDIPQESAREGDLEKDFPQTARREHQRDMPDASSASSVRRGIQTAVASSRHSPLGRVRTEQESPEGGADTETHLKRRELQNTPPALPCPSSSRLKQRPTSPSPVRASPHPSSPIQERAHSPLTARQKPLQTVSMSREVKEDGGDKEEGREGDPPTVIRTKGDVYRSRVNGELRQQGGVRLQFSTSASPRSLEAQEEKGGNEPPGVPLVPTSPSHISLTVEERGTEQSRNLRVENREEGGEGEERGGEIRVVQEEAKEKRSFEQSSFFPKRNEEEGEKVSEADAEVIICSPGCVAPRQAVCSPTAASSVPASREVGMDSENGEPFRPPSSQRPLNAWGEEGGGSFERKKGVTAGSTKFDREEGQRILEDERGRNVRMRLVETERQRQVVKGEDSDSPSSPFSVPSLSCLWSLSINRNQKEKVPRETTRLSRGKGGGSAGWRETVAKCTASLGHREALHNKAERSRESLEPLRSSRSQGRGVDEGRGGFGFAGDADETETVSFVASAAPQTPSIARASRFLELPDCEEEEEDLEAAIMRMHSPPRPPSLREVRTEHHERGRGGGRGTLPSVREGGEQEGPQYVQEGEGEETEQGLGLDECGGHADYSESEGEEEERELDPRLAALGVCEEDVRDVHASWSALFRSLKALAAGGGDKTLPPSEEVRLTVGSPASQTHFGISVGSEDTKTAPLTSEDAPFLFTADGEGEGENPHCLRETDTAREKLQREEEEMVCDEKPQAVKTKKKKRALSEIKTLLTSFLSHVCSVQQNIILARVEREKEREREDERQREKKEGWGPPGRSRMAQQTAAGEGVGGLRESMALARSADNQELLESLWSRVAALESEVQKREEEERRLCVQLSSAKRALGVREREEAELEHMLRETEKRLETEAMENKRLRLEMRGGWGDRGDGAEGEREWTEGEEERRLECKNGVQSASSSCSLDRALDIPQDKEEKTVDAQGVEKRETKKGWHPSAALHREVVSLEAERDEWKRKAEEAMKETARQRQKEEEAARTTGPSAGSADALPLDSSLSLFAELQGAGEEEEEEEEGPVLIHSDGDVDIRLGPEEWARLSESKGAGVFASLLVLPSRPRNPPHEEDARRPPGATSEPPEDSSETRTDVQTEGHSASSHCTVKEGSAHAHLSSLPAALCQRPGERPTPSRVRLSISDDFRTLCVFRESHAHSSTALPTRTADAPIEAKKKGRPPRRGREASGRSISRSIRTILPLSLPSSGRRRQKEKPTGPQKAEEETKRVEDAEGSRGSKDTAKGEESEGRGWPVPIASISAAVFGLPPALFSLLPALLAPLESPGSGKTEGLRQRESNHENEPESPCSAACGCAPFMKRSAARDRPCVSRQEDKIQQQKREETRLADSHTVKKSTRGPGGSSALDPSSSALPLPPSLSCWDVCARCLLLEIEVDRETEPVEQEVSSNEGQIATRRSHKPSWEADGGGEGRRRGREGKRSLWRSLSKGAWGGKRLRSAGGNEEESNETRDEEEKGQINLKTEGEAGEGEKRRRSSDRFVLILLMEGHREAFLLGSALNSLCIQPAQRAAMFAERLHWQMRLLVPSGVPLVKEEVKIQVHGGKGPGGRGAATENETEWKVKHSLSGISEESREEEQADHVAEQLHLCGGGVKGDNSDRAGELLEGAVAAQPAASTTCTTRLHSPIPVRPVASRSVTG